MKAFFSSWYGKTLIIAVISVLVCVGIYYIGFTDWSDGFRGMGKGLGRGMGGQGHGHDHAPLTLTTATIPFIKAILMIGIPMTVGILIGRGYKKVSRRKA